MIDDIWHISIKTFLHKTFQGQGGYIPEIYSQKDNDIVDDIKGGYDVREKCYLMFLLCQVLLFPPQVWLGATNGDDDHWKWFESNQTFGYINWATSEPLVLTDNACMYMDLAGE